MASLDARLHASQWATQPAASWLEELHPEVFPDTHRRLTPETREIVQQSVIAAMRGFHATLVPGFERFTHEVEVGDDPILERAQAYVEAAELGIAALAHLLRELAGVELVIDGLGPDLPSPQELVSAAAGLPQDRRRAS